MDVQYIWPGLTLGVLRGMTNVWTVRNWLVPRLFSPPPYRSRGKGFLNRSLRTPTRWNLNPRRIYSCAPRTKISTQAKAQTKPFTLIRDETAPGPKDSDLLESGNSHFLCVSGEICPLIRIQRILGMAPRYCLRGSKTGSARENGEVVLGSTRTSGFCRCMF